MVKQLAEINFHQLNAMMQLFMREREIMLLCHKSFLSQVSQMDMPPELHSIVVEYSRLINEAAEVSLNGVEQILENDIGARPAGGIQ
jgi:hypothetical protein